MKECNKSRKLMETLMLWRTRTKGMRERRMAVALVTVLDQIIIKQPIEHRADSQLIKARVVYPSRGQSQE